MDTLAPNKVEIEVYLEGVKVPTSSIVINETMGSPPVCEINFPAHSGALRVLPGTLVHIFGLVEMLPGIGQTKKLRRQKVLLFEGEISGLSYTKSSSERVVSLTAQSIIHKWTQVYMHSADMMSDKLLFNALFLYQDWDTVETDNIPSKLDDDGNVTATETPIEPKKDGANKYLRFEYDHSLKGLNDLEFFIYKAWAGAEADTEAKERGDWMPFFTDLIQHLEYLNLYYGLFSKMYRIVDTNFVFPNRTITEALEQFLADRTFLQTPSSMAERIALIDILIQILSMINYVMLMPAAPTYTVHPYLKLNRAPDNGLGDFDEVPMRTIMLPDLKFAAPALCNIIFPDEVTRMGFTRNMAGEYTRLFCNASPTSLKVDASNFGDFQSTYIVPGLPLIKPQTEEAKDETKPGFSPYLFGFTPEETYRGVNPVRTNYTGLEEGFLKSLARGPGDTPADETSIAQAWSPTSAAGAVAFNTAALSFYTSRYSARQCNISANWNPFRMVGLPALFFDTDGSPSIMGVLSQHTVSIDAAGVATSDMVLALPRVFYDIEGLDAVDLILPSNVSVPSSKEKRTLEAMDQEILKHSAMEADPIPWLPAWYDKEWYGSEYVGRDVYSVLTAGTRALWSNDTDSVSKHDSAWSNLDANNGNPSFPEAVRKKYNDTAKWSMHVDYSIFKFIRNVATAKFEIPVGQDAELAPTNDDSESAIIAKRIAYSVRQLKRKYHEAKTNGRLKSFMTKLTNRNLTPKINYWKFIGIGLTDPDTSMDPVEDPFQGLNRMGFWNTYYRPTIKDGPHKGKVLGITPSICKNILHQFYDKELTWEDAIKTYKLHPFTEIRRDHVLTMTTLVAQSMPRAGR